MFCNSFDKLLKFVVRSFHSVLFVSLLNCSANLRNSVMDVRPAYARRRTMFKTGKKTKTPSWFFSKDFRERKIKAHTTNCSPTKVIGIKNFLQV